MICRRFFYVMALLCFASVTGAEDTPVAPIPLGDFGLTFTPPPAATWEPTQHSTSRIVAFTARSHDAIVAFELLPDDMVIDKPITAAILKQLRGEHVKTKAKMFLEPVAESDDRFTLKVHERFEVGKDDKKKVSDQLHMYLYVGNHLMMATVNSVAGDPETVKIEHQNAEDSLLSASYPGMKPRKVAPRPTTKPLVKSTTKPTTRPATNKTGA